MGSETACWVRRDAFFTFSNSYSSSYGCWFTRRLWRISFRYRFHSHFHCTFLVPHLITFLVTIWWLNSDGSCVLSCVAGDVWCNWCKITCWTSSRGFNLIVFFLCCKFCFFYIFFILILALFHFSGSQSDCVWTSSRASPRWKLAIAWTSRSYPSTGKIRPIGTFFLNGFHELWSVPEA